MSRRQRQHAPFGKPGRALGPGIAQNQDVIRRHVEPLVVDGRLHRRVAVEDERGALVPMKPRVAGRGLHHCAVRTQVAAENRERALVVDRVRERPDDVLVRDPRALEAMAQRFPGDGDGGGVEPGLQFRHQGAQAAGVEKVLHEVLPAGRPDVGDQWRHAAERVEVVEGQRDAGSARDGDQLHHRVGRAAGRHGDNGRVAHGRFSHDPVRRQVLPDHLDGPSAAGRTHPLVPRSAAGIDLAPGRLSPRASAIAVIVEAVPMVMQVPAERAMPP